MTQLYAYSTRNCQINSPTRPGDGICTTARKDLSILEPTIRPLPREKPPEGQGRTEGHCIFDAFGSRAAWFAFRPEPATHGNAAPTSERPTQRLACRWVRQRQHRLVPIPL